MLEVLAIIPARSGSKGILNKNMVLINGKPLLQYTYDAAIHSKKITRIILSTDSEEYAKYAKKQGIETLMRPVQLAEDDTPMKDVIDYHLAQLEANNYIPDVFVLLQPTSPLRTAHNIDEALESLEANSKADAVVSVMKVPHNFTPLKVMTLDDEGFLHFYQPDGEKYSTRQKLPQQYYARNGAAIYAVYTKAYMETHSLYGNVCIPYLMDSKVSVDIDEIEDIEIASWRISQRIT